MEVFCLIVTTESGGEALGNIPEASSFIKPTTQNLLMKKKRHSDSYLTFF